MHRILAALVLALLAHPALAQGSDQFTIGADFYGAGAGVTFGTPGAQDVFGAGESIRVEDAVTGSAHLAARRIDVQAPIGQNLYAAGMDVSVAAPVAGTATLSGFSVVVGAPVEGSLRVFARTVRLLSNMGGTALVAGQNVEIAGTIAGDADISAERLTFAPGARIEGNLTLRQPRGMQASIAAEVVTGTVTRIELEPSQRPAEVLKQPQTWFAVAVAMVVGLLLGVAIVALLAFLAASLLRDFMEEAVDRMVLTTTGTFVAGFFTQAILLGAAIVVAMTVLGLIALPVLFLIAGLLGFAGYVVASYALGVRLLFRPEQGAPDTFGARLGAATLGAFVLALLGLLPFVGWWIVLFAAILGTGALLPARVEMGSRAAP